MGPTTTQVLEHIGPLHLYKYPTIGHRKNSTDKQHSLHDPNSHTMFQCLKIWYQGIQLQINGRALAHPPLMACCDSTNGHQDTLSEFS